MQKAKKALVYFLFLILFIAFLNFPVPTRQGVNEAVRIFKLPLYIKVIEFLDRNYWHKVIVGEIIEGCASDKEKVLAIFNWVTANIHDVPEGFNVFDDHVLNIAIRRYGISGQKADLFTTLCVYSGIPAFLEIKCPGEGKRAAKFTLSYLLVDGEWMVFDLANNVLFKKCQQPITKDFMSKAEKQVPLYRLTYEVRKLFGYENRTKNERGLI